MAATIMKNNWQFNSNSKQKKTQNEKRRERTCFCLKKN